MVAAPSCRAVRACALPVLVLLACGCALAAASAQQLERGRSLLAQYQCGTCHAIPEVPAARGRTGPTLVAFGRRSYIAGEVPNRPAALARWIVAPAELVPGTLMPAMGVSPEDARDMAAYLLSLE
jgi:cytochrome c2